MNKKTFKIGEYAIGGIITAEVTPTEVAIKALDWTTKKPVNEKTFANEKSHPWSGTIELQYGNLLDSLGSCLFDWTSSYYAEQVLDFIKSKLK